MKGNNASIITEYQYIFKALQDGILVITGSTRLARHLSEAYNNWRAQQDSMGVWPTPPVLAYSAWLQEQWQRCASDTKQSILSSAQELLIWREVVNADTACDPAYVLDGDALAKQAMQAYALLCDWSLSIDKVKIASCTSEHEAFCRWCQQFAARAQQLKRVPQAQASIMLVKNLNINASNMPIMPTQMLWCGFDELTPAQKNICQALESHSCQIELYAMHDTKILNKPKAVYRCRTALHEARHIAARIRQLYSLGKSITILPANMNEHANLLRILQEELDPKLVLSSMLKNKNDMACINVSLGLPLSEQTLVKHSVLLLQIAGGASLAAHEWAQLLLSPYLYKTTDENERMARAELELALRANACMQRASAKTMLLWVECQHAKHEKLATTTAQWQDLLKFIGLSFEKGDIKGKKSPSYWSQYVQLLLADSAWPWQQANKDSPHNADERAIYTHWQQALRTLASLDDVTGNISWRACVQELQRLCQTIPFRPDPGFSDIHLMGMLEITGLHADIIFLTGMHEQQFPAMANPQPLLPITLQKQYKMPHADAERELIFAKLLWQRLLASAEHVEISFAAMGDGGEVLRPTAFVTGEYIIDADEPKSQSWAVRMMQTTSTTQDIADTNIALGKDESHALNTSSLTAQAQCPFQAFAAYRLQLREIETAEAGVSYILHGSLLHKALEIFWQGLQKNNKATQTNLLELMALPDNFNELIIACVTQSLQHHKKQTTHISDAVLKVESWRLQSLLQQWFKNVEAKRPDFSVVECEQALIMPLGEITLRMRLDRMDEDVDGNKILLDYKSGGSHTSKNIQDSIPQQPQLPAYALALAASNNTPAALGFAIVNEGHHKLNMLEISDEHIIGWQHGLHELATNYVTGNADVSPRFADSCNYCSYISLCRYQGLVSSDQAVVSDQRIGQPIDEQILHDANAEVVGIDDADARWFCLETDKSFLVQAPAGSGKTELLTRRILALLATVEQPERILALTFTRKAAGEMRQRIIDALNMAKEDEPSDSYQRETWQLARDALAQDVRCGWDLLANPNRLRLLTIDAFNAWLARFAPLGAGLGQATPEADDSGKLYRRSVQSLLKVLDKTEAQSEITALQNALKTCLQHVGNQMPALEEVLVSMLSKREQWLPHVLSQTNNDSDLLRQNLAAAMETVIESTLANIAIPKRFHNELLALLQCNFNCNAEHWPQANAYDMPLWHKLADILLIAKGTWKKRLLKKDFSCEENRLHLRDLLKEMCTELENNGDTQTEQALAETRSLPSSPELDDTDWEVLQAIMIVLRYAAAYLWQEARRRRVTDFSEVAARALQALGSATAPTDMLLHLDAQLEHILVDEFQDTSHNQVELLRRLSCDWQTGDGRTLFLVGDPMQSIYGFRQADVGLFVQARNNNIGLPFLEFVQLRSNFRAAAPIVAWVNAIFAKIFPYYDILASGGIAYAASNAVRDFSGGVQAHIQTANNNDADIAIEASNIATLIADYLAKKDSISIGVLAESWNRLYPIMSALRQKGIAFRSDKELSLADIPAVRDALTLTRTLLQPADKLAMASLLRSPAVGLSLQDLCCWQQNVAEKPLSADGNQRLQWLLNCLQALQANYHRQPLRRLVEAAWIKLRMPLLLNTPRQLEDVQRYFNLLDSLPTDEDPLAAIQQAMQSLYATPDERASLVTVGSMHAAKGLEWDVVILPALGRKSAGNHGRDLLLWAQLPFDNDQDMLMAARASKGGKNLHADFINNLHKQRKNLERQRLLYVACTRARQHLHLFGHVSAKTGKAVSSSLLAMLGITGLKADPDSNNFSELEQIQTESEHKFMQALALNTSLPPAPAALEIAQKERPQAQGIEVEYSWAGDSARIIGVSLHALLQEIADGRRDLKDNNKMFLRTHLRHQGIGNNNINPILQRCMQAVELMQKSKHMQWLLNTNHIDAHNEWKLSNAAGINIILDRSFIDYKTNIRWVIDYKTGQHIGTDIKDFLHEEGKRYQDQLRRYRQILHTLEPSNQIRTALYYPMLDALLLDPDLS
ncbi:MAG: UvrD-helicase domain-containing protein [Mariprofundales bacterium]